MTTANSRGRIWFEALTGTSTPASVPSVLSATAGLGGEQAHFLAVVPAHEAKFPRAVAGEVGLEEGWNLAWEIRAVVAADAAAPADVKRPIIAVVDVPSQAYGYREELIGIHQALAGAVDAYATARLAGHPVVAFVVGKAISGAFLSHGLQANRIVALDDEGIMVQVMGKAAAARITRRTVEQLDEIAMTVPATAYDGASFAKLGALHALLSGTRADDPTSRDVAAAREALAAAVTDARGGPADLVCRLDSPEAKQTRAASIEVRRRLAAAWRD